MGVAAAGDDGVGVAAAGDDGVGVTAGCAGDDVLIIIIQKVMLASQQMCNFPCQYSDNSCPVFRQSVRCALVRLADVLTS